MSIDKYTWFLEVHDFHFVKAQHFALELKLMKCFEYLNSNHLNCYVSQNLWRSLNFLTLKMSNNHDQPTLVWGTSFGSAPCLFVIKATQYCVHGRLQQIKEALPIPYGSAPNRKNKTRLPSFFDTKNKTFNNSRGLRASGKVSVATETRVG